MQKIVRALLLVMLAASPVIFLTPAWGQRDIRTERVQFKGGASSTIVEGKRFSF